MERSRELIPDTVESMNPGSFNNFGIDFAA